jgi:pectinesterase
MFRSLVSFAALLSLAPLMAAQPAEIVVAADGTGTHTTIQSALDAIPAGNTEPRLISVKPGTYKEHILLPKEKPFITLVGLGTDPSQVVLSYDMTARSIDPATGKEVGTSGSASWVVSANDFTARNVTFENSAGDRGQAVAMRIMSDRVVFRNCRFLGWQDTLYPNGGRNYFVDCHVEGRVDFIFGRGQAVFENCTIHSKNGGFVTAASTLPERQFGLVFLDCKLTGDGDPAYLGRPWRDHAMVAFVRCEIGGHVRPEGWHNWNNPAREQTARFIEYGNTGPGADRSRRVPWAKTLSDEEARAYTAKHILAGDDGWDPTK